MEEAEKTIKKNAVSTRSDMAQYIRAFAPFFLEKFYS